MEKMTVARIYEMVKSGELSLHHSAWSRVGNKDTPYVSRHTSIVVSYNGRFGVGYMVITNTGYSNQYMSRTYFVKKS